MHETAASILNGACSAACARSKILRPALTSPAVRSPRATTPNGP